MRVVLEVTKGPQQGERFSFERPEAFVVGRKASDRVQFRIPDDRYFSRYHMMIEVSPPHCFLRDLGSRNGTWVNGKRVRQADLKDGDVIHGGKTDLCVHIDSSPQRTPAEEPVPPAPVAAPAAAPAARGNWETDLFEIRSPRGSARQLCCAICRKPAEDTQLSDVTDTTLIAYVCGDCRERREDPAQPVPNYEKLSTLGQGVLGPVYKARRISTGKLAVLKVLAREMAETPAATQTFLRQMLLAARLDHPHIVPVIEMGQAGSDLWLASAFIEGLDSRELLRQLDWSMPIPDAVAITAQILDALEYAHQQSLVHRDVKPSNILVQGGPGAYHAMLSDFGLMRNVDEAGVSGITRKGEVRGTVPFMPPEQVLDCRFVKPAGDLYATAATLYWLLTGEFVYDFEARDARGEQKDPYLVILESTVIPIHSRNDAVPDAVARVIETALAPEPEDRFETASEMARALRRAVA